MDNNSERIKDNQRRERKLQLWATTTKIIIIIICGEVFE